jgi:acyl-coenzyme A thioesterase PaaI-like protein
MRPERANNHVLSQLGFGVKWVGDDLEGTVSVIDEMCVPGTGRLRTSLLATWADHLSGLLAATAVAPRVPVTLQLDVHLYTPAPGSGTVRGRGRVLKAGRSVFFSDVEFSHDGAVFAMSTSSFMTSPDESLSLPASLSLDGPPPVQRLTVPFAERVGCERQDPGTAVLPRSDDGLNSSNTFNGGLIALVVEEAVLSLSPGATVSSLILRYLRPVRIGPAVASARTGSGLGEIEVRDAGNGNRLSVLATTRFFDH